MFFLMPNEQCQSTEDIQTDRIILKIIIKNNKNHLEIGTVRINRHIYFTTTVCARTER